MQILSRVLITDGQSYLGYLAALQLVHAGFSVSAIVENSESDFARDLASHGVSLTISELGDFPILKTAFSQSDGVFFFDSKPISDVSKYVKKICSLADLALSSRVSYFLYTSVGCGEHVGNFPSAKAHARIESHINAIGLPSTIFRPSFFYSRFTHPPLLEMILSGEIALPLSPNRKIQLLSEHDFAMLVSMAFSSFHNFLGKTIEIASSERSMSDIAAMITTLLGRPVRYRQVSYDDFEAASGKSERLLYEWLEAYGYHADLPFIRKQLGDPQTLADYLRSINFPWFLSQAAGG